MYKFSEDSGYHPRSRTDDDLWDDDEKTNVCIRVKKNSTKDGYHTWKLFENQQCIFTINSIDVNKKIVKFLFTVEGLSFLINEYKKGCNDLCKFKKAIKDYVKNNNQ
jgi:hypothetical protein